MNRKITGFYQDEKEDWVADLDCFHGQHVRHQPPFFNRPWVITATGRDEKLGEILNCVRCDRLEFPENLVAYRKTATFTEHTVPKGLLKNHSLAEGHWGLLCVLEGQLQYQIEDKEREPMLLTGNENAVIVPCMLHAVKPLGPVRFYVEFFSKSGLE